MSVGFEWLLPLITPVVNLNVAWKRLGQVLKQLRTVSVLGVHQQVVFVRQRLARPRIDRGWLEDERHPRLVAPVTPFAYPGVSEERWRPLQLSLLCSQIVSAAVHGVPPGKQLSLDIDPHPALIDSNQAHHLTLVINELTTNRLKHAREMPRCWKSS